MVTLATIFRHYGPVYHTQYGERILENIRRFAPETWTIDAWCVPSDLSLALGASSDLFARLPDADLVLSLAENGSVAQLLPNVVEHTSARAVIAPVDNTDWLPNELVYQLHTRLTEAGVKAVFPKPFCSLTERSYIAPRMGPENDAYQQVVSFEDPWIGEFARHFGRPEFQIECDNQWIIEVDLERDAACGCARAIADQLAGVDVQKSIAQAGLLHLEYPCLAATRVEPDLQKSLLQVSGDFVREAVEIQIRPCLPQVVADELETGRLGNNT